MAVALASFPQFFDAFGDPLAGGKLYTYEAGTSTPLATYTNEDGTTPNANPVILDSAGRASIWLAANISYKLVLKTSAEVTVATVDEYFAGATPEQLTVAGIVPATGGTYTGLVNFTGGATFTGTAAQQATTLDTLGLGPVQNANLWINSDFRIAQRTLGAIADNNYGHDRAVVLCDTGSLTVSSTTTGVDGLPNAMRLLQPDAGAKRLGVVQIVESYDCIPYRGKQLVMTAKVRCSATTTVRAALVAWTGAVDVPTRDVVNTWGSTTYTAGNFFVASTSTIAVTAQVCSAGAWTDVLVSSASAGGVVAPTGMNNLYMVFWTEGTVAQNVTFDVANVSCGMGTRAPVWTPPDAQQELARCQRYYENGSMNYSGYAPAGNGIGNWMQFCVQKRAVPTVALSSTGYSNASTATTGSVAGNGFALNIVIAATGVGTVSTAWTASAEF